MGYTKIFNPDECAGSPRPSDADADADADAAVAAGPRRAGDRSTNSVYIYTPELVLAVNVALATGRPLLLRGLPGTGKSSLARSVAECLGWRYYEEVVTSRTQGRDLQWRFDTLRRLSDASAGLLKDREDTTRPYVEPGVLWWALDRDSARRRGLPPGSKDFTPASEPGAPQPEHERAVVLLDEVDKADPDVPNNLLVVLGSYKFSVPELNLEVPPAGEGAPKPAVREPPLIIITTNDERELPAAFLRRCVIYVLKRPTPEKMIEIAAAHFGEEDGALYSAVAGLMQEAAPKPDDPAAPSATPPSTAEFLDAVEACVRLGIKDPRASKDDWEIIMKATLWKPREPLGADA